MTDIETLESYVDAGINLLDKNLDPGWRDLINLDNLDVGYSTLCVLGQIYGSPYEAQVERDIGFPLISEASEHHGFYLVDPMQYGDEVHGEYKEGYELLTEIWKQKLSQNGSPESITSGKQES